MVAAKQLGTAVLSKRAVTAWSTITKASLFG